MMTLALLPAAVAVAALLVVALLLGRTWLRLRGTRLVSCPETGKPVAVDLDLRYGLATSSLGNHGLRLKDCTRWPERRHCGQTCLMELEAAPQACLVRNIVGGWYAGRSCVYCGRPFGVLRWHDDKPGLRTPEGITLQWSEVPPQSLPRLLAVCAPVCWDCCVAESFRHDHPELVTERPSRSAGPAVPPPA